MAYVMGEQEKMGVAEAVFEEAEHVTGWDEYHKDHYEFIAQFLWPYQWGASDVWDIEEKVELIADRYWLDV